MENNFKNTLHCVYRLFIVTYMSTLKIRAMKKNCLVFVLLFLLSGFVPVISFAQDVAPQNLIVFEEFVSPADLPEFSKVQTEVFDLWKKNEMDIPFFCYQNDDNAFYWVIPIENFAGIDALYAKMMGINKKMKDSGFDTDAKFRDLSTMRQTVISGSPDLSYHPSGVFGQTKEKPFIEWTFCYLKTGHEKEAGDAIKKYIEFYDGIDETYEWDVYMVLLGHDTPCWILMTRSESELALRTLESELNEKYGENFKELWSGFAKHVRRFENKKGWFRADWSMNVSQ